MRYFTVFSGFLLILYLMGFVKRSNMRSFSFMDRDFTTAFKGFAILTVVWAHTGARLGVGGIQFIAGVGVALFLICSGYGLEMSYQQKGLEDFWKKRILGVCVPFWIVELIGLLITGSFTVEKYLKDFFFIKAATGYGWFMQYIIICYILFFGVKMLAEKIKINETAMLIASFALWFIIESCFFANPDMPFLQARQMFSFPLGAMIAKNKDRTEGCISGKSALVLIIVGGGITGIFFMVVTQLPAIKALPYVASNVMALFTVLPLAVAVICFANAFKGVLKNKTLVGAGIISYEIYLVHAFTLGFVKDSLLWIGVFIVITVALTVEFHLITMKLGRARN